MTVVVPICNRTNYTKLRPVLMGLSQMGISPKIILSSSILLSQYGKPYLDIENDGFEIVRKIDCLMSNDSTESMAKTSALSIIEHSSSYKALDPKAVVIVGDRFDMFPAALSACMMNIPILHIQGGEISGSIDDSIRNMISIMSSRHYVSTEQARKRVARITEDEENVILTGCPAVESVSKTNVGDFLDVNSFSKKFKDPINIAKDEPYILVLAHPNTKDPDDIHMNTIMESCLSFAMKVVAFYPNNDSYNKNIVLDIIHEKSDIINIKHCPHEDFVKLMAHASCMVGNSSSGIREAASFGTPVVNIGNRQQFREQNKNTINVDCNKQDITRSIKKSLDIGRYKRSNIYFASGSANNIALDIASFSKS